MPVIPLDVVLALGVGAILLTPLIGLAKAVGEAVLKTATRVLLSTVVDVQILNDKITGQAVVGYLNHHGRPVRHATAQGIDAVIRDVFEVDTKRMVFFRVTWLTWTLFLVRGRPILYIPTVNPEGGSEGILEAPKNAYATLVALRGTIDWTRFYTETSEMEHQRTTEVSEIGRRRVQVLRFGGHLGESANKNDVVRGDDVVPSVIAPDLSMATPINYRPEDLIITREDVEPPLARMAITPTVQHILDTVRFWHRSKAWYGRHHIPWKMGLGLYGLRGSGKTSTARAIAQDLGLPIHIFDLATMTTADFRSAWKSSKAYGQRIVLWDDFDTLYHGRENQIQGGVNFGAILEAIDGIEEENGMLLIVMTNHVAHLDEALGRPLPDGGSTRPGRIGVFAELPPLGTVERLFVANRILHDDEESRRLIAAHPDDSPDQLTQRAIRRALEIRWSDRKAA